MQKIADTANIVTLDDALYTLASMARTRYAGEHGRIDRGLVLALNGAVTIREADGAALVQSATDANIVYEVKAGRCDCPDAERAPEFRCKHRWAVCLTKRARQATAYYTMTDATQGLVCGGHRATADAQRAQEGAEGGLVARICNHHGARRQ